MTTLLYLDMFYDMTFIKKTSLAGVEPAIFRFVVWRVSIAPQALPIYIFPPSFSLLFDCCHDYPFLTLSSVGSYQVGYTRSHPNTEVKMLRVCSVPLCSHRWERQVIYLFYFFNIIIQYIQRQYDGDIMKLYWDNYNDTRDAMLIYTIRVCDYFIIFRYVLWHDFY